jgi:cyclopropane-fatty-acyl-phospholipid synthase
MGATMSLIAQTIFAAERIPLPDLVVRTGIRTLVGRTADRLARGDADSDARFAQAMAQCAIAEDANAANSQHYEVPAAFFERVLGPSRKYSSCFYKAAATTLREAEEEALRQTVEHARLADGQDILELGCGWGSLSLWMARQFPNARIVAVSNSHSQRQVIEAQAAARGLRNVLVITEDMNVFAPNRRFDRVVSVEMFEHMMNWRALLTNVRAWLKHDGRFFMHIFTHRSGAYLFERANKEDWIAQHFFTGGVMPSHQLIRQYDDLFEVEREWRWSGTHYARTARLACQFRFPSRRNRRDPAPDLWRRHRALDAPLALVFPRHLRPVRPRRRRRMGHQPLFAEGGVSFHPACWSVAQCC